MEVMYKPKILHLLSSYLPNTENWIYNLISNSKGTEKHIGAYQFPSLTNNESNASNNPTFKYATQAIHEKYDEQYNSTKKGLARYIEVLSIKFHQLLNGTTQSKLIQYCKKENIEILHAHFANIGWDMLEIKRKTNLPFLISFYGWDYEMLPHVRPVFKKRYQILFKEADGFICEGDHSAKVLEDMGCPKQKIHVVNLGVMVSEIPFFTRVKNKNTLKLVQLASYTEKKGHEYTIRAFAEAIKRCPDMELTFIGNERKKGLLDKLKQLVADHQLEDFIHFLPPIDYVSLHEVLEKYDAFIHPSCYTTDKDCEGGAPIVFLDAQATGMPIISTLHCDIPSEVLHKKTGLLVEEKDIVELSAAIETFYSMDYEQYQQYSIAARLHVEKMFDIKRNAIKLESVYSQYLK